MLYSSTPMIFECREFQHSLLRQESVMFDLLISELNGRYTDSISALLHIDFIEELVELGLDETIADQLAELVHGKAHSSDKDAEVKIVICFLSQLASNDCGKGMSRHLKRLVRRASKQITLSPPVVKRIAGFIQHFPV
jgi:hypothetical protein